MKFNRSGTWVSMPVEEYDNLRYWAEMAQATARKELIVAAAYRELETATEAHNRMMLSPRVAIEGFSGLEVKVSSEALSRGDRIIKK